MLADGRVLLCKRNIEPRWGKWTLPAGFMELDETTAQGAARETDEEAGADIRMGRLFSIVNVPRVGQVHLFYTAEVLSEQLNPGPETIEARFFREDEILGRNRLSHRQHHAAALSADRDNGVQDQVHSIDLV